MAEARQDKEGVIVPKAAQMTAREKFRQGMLSLAELEGSAGERVDELQARQIEQIMGARSEDQLFASMEMQGLTGLRDLDNGQVITITGYTVAKGSGEYKGAGFYAIISAFDADTGEEMMLDTGVERIIGFLRMVETGAAGVKFPVTVKVLKKATANGEVITFGRVRPRTVQQ